MSDDVLINDGDAAKVSPELLAEAQEVVNSLTKTAKIFRTYPRENTISITAIDNLAKTFDDYLNKHEALELFVERHELQFEGNSVYSETDPRRSFALKLDRDGVRRMLFLKGIGRSELVGLIETLTTEVNEESLDDDLVTLLWEKQLEHVKVFVLDNMALSESGFDEGLADSGEQTGTDVPENGAPMGARSMPRPAASTEQPNLNLGAQTQLCETTKAKIRPITSEQATLLGDETRREETHDISDDLTAILFDILQTETQPEVYRNASKVLLELAMINVKTAAFAPAADLVERLRALSTGDAVREEVRVLIREQVRTLADASHLQIVLDTMTAHENLNASDLARFLATLPAEAAPGLCPMLDVARYEKIVEHSFRLLGREDLRRLVPAVGGENTSLAVKVLAILAASADAELVAELGPTLSAAGDSVKIASVPMLQSVKGAASRELLLSFGTSLNATVRRSALRALADFPAGNAPAGPLRAEAAARDFDDRSLDEKKMLFTAVARLEGASAVKFIADIVLSKRWFERPNRAETRACAALALGEIDNEAAIEALERCASDKSETVVTAARLALNRHRAVAVRSAPT